MNAKVTSRYAGPRMLLRHPWLGIMFWRDGWRPAPQLPQQSAGKEADREA